jgi:hypothetical protein
MQDGCLIQNRKVVVTGKANFLPSVIYFLNPVGCGRVNLF